MMRAVRRELAFSDMTEQHKDAQDKLQLNRPGFAEGRSG